MSVLLVLLVLVSFLVLVFAFALLRAFLKQRPQGGGGDPHGRRSRQGGVDSIEFHSTLDYASQRLPRDRRFLGMKGRPSFLLQSKLGQRPKVDEYTNFSRGEPASAPHD